MDLHSISSDFFNPGGTYWLPTILIAVSFLLMVWRAVCRCLYRLPETKRIKGLWLLASCMVLVWSMGFWLYMYAIDHNTALCQACECTAVSDFELLCRSAVASLGMFMFNIDSNVFDNINGLPLVKGLISLLSLIAGGLTIWLIVLLFWKRLWASLKAWWCSLFEHSNELYVFFGINEATKLLADSINKDSKGRKYRLLFVEFPIIEEDNNDSGLGSIMKSVTHRVDTFRTARAYHAQLSIANTLPNCVSMPSGAKTYSILQRIGLSDVAKMIRKTSNKIHLFFLSDNDVFNIESVAVLKRDATIQAKSDKYECIFYCHTRSNSIRRVIENDMPKSGISVKVVDSSRLCVDLLKYHKEFHPVNYVDIQDDATVSSPFNALVVGFGEVGLDTVRFLYEFGAFVKTGSSAENVERSDFHCDVVDKNMSDLAGQFIANAPAIKPTMSFAGGVEGASSLITLHNMDCHSVDFYQHLEQWIHGLNYVVVATGDDEMNISLAVRIFRLAVRHDTDFERFRILVRVRRDENGHFHQIAHYYNRLFAAEMKKGEGNRQNIVSKEEIIDTPITLFGSFEDIYRYEYIVSDDLLEKVKKFKERYDSSIEALQKQSGNEVYPTMTWDEEIASYLQLDGDYAGYSPTFSNVMKLRRMQSQNFENCYHIDTKQRLAMCALGADEYNALTNHQLFRKNNETTYHWKAGVKPKEKLIKVLDTLAQTEHLRWNASHEILGYQDKGGERDKDEARLFHGCIKPWTALSEDIRSFDYNVVDVSLDIIETKEKNQTDS